MGKKSLLIGDVVEIVEPLLVEGVDKFFDVVGEVGVIVDIVADDHPILDSDTDPLAGMGDHYLVNFPSDENDEGYQPLWFPKSALKTTNKDCNIKPASPPKFKLKDVVTICGSTVCNGETTTESVGKVGFVNKIELAAHSTTNDGSKVTLPYQIILIDDIINHSIIQRVLDLFLWFPEDSLELMKSRDEFESPEELQKYFEGFAPKEDN
jgi:hypothetical protein